MSFNLWQEKGWIRKHKPSSREITELLGIADRALKDCQAAGLSNDGKLDMAHTALLQSSAAALAAAGYRAAREGYHYYVIQSLAFTIGLDETKLRTLDKFRRKRNISDYERPGTVTEQEATEMISLAAEIRQLVVAWIRSKHSELATELLL